MVTGFEPIFLLEKRDLSRIYDKAFFTNSSLQQIKFSTFLSFMLKKSENAQHIALSDMILIRILLPPEIGNTVCILTCSAELKKEQNKLPIELRKYSAIFSNCYFHNKGTPHLFPEYLKSKNRWITIYKALVILLKFSSKLLTVIWR